MFLGKAVIMDILKKNMQIFKVKFTSEHYNVGDLLNHPESELMAEPRFDGNRTLYIAYNINNIEHIKNIAGKLNEKSILFVYYRDERYLYELLSKVDFTSKEGKLAFYAGDYKDAEGLNRLDEMFKTLLYTYSNMCPILLNSLDLSYIRGAKEFFRYINDIRDNFVFLIGNDLNDTLCGVQNRLLNLHAYVANPGFNEFKEKYGSLYRDKPAVIVSSGPSLDKNVHLLKAYENKALILSCDGSASTLKRHGIKPDIVGSVERAWDTYRAFYENKEFDPRIIFSGPAVVRPEIVEMFAGKKMISVFKSRDVYGDWMNTITSEDKGTVYSGSSVAHFLLNFADALGCNPIILVGQDLAYSEEGVSHADAAEVDESIDVSKATEWVKDYEDKDIPSSRIWKSFLLTFEEIVRDTDKVIIDATEGGAHIKGSVIRGLEETLEQYCIEELPSVADLLDRINVGEAYINTARESSFEGIYKAIHIFDGLLMNIRSGKKMNKKAVMQIEKGINTQKQLDRIYDTLEFVDKEIVQNIARDRFLMMLFQYPIYSAIRSINVLNTSKYTIETICFNLKLHWDMLYIFELYANKMLKVLINGLEDNKDFFGKLPEFNEKLDNLERDYKYLYESDKYDTIPV